MYIRLNASPLWHTTTKSNSFLYGNFFTYMQICSCADSQSVFAQLLTDDDYQQLRLKQAHANVQPKRVQSRNVKIFAAVEEERLVISCNDGSA